MKMGIEELAGTNIGGDGTGAAISDVEMPTIGLAPLERNILITAASPYYHGGYIAHVADALGIDEMKVTRSMQSIKGKLDISSFDTIFTALCITLKYGLISIDEILDGKDLAEELPRFKVALRKLGRPQKRILAEFYNQAVYTRSSSMAEVAETLQYTPGGLSSSFGGVGGKSQSPYERLGISNRAQLAFFAHIYMHYMHNPVEEQLTGKQLDALEEVVVHMYNGGIIERAMKALNVQTSMEVVLKALDMGFYALLLEANIPAFVSLDPAKMNFLKAKPETVAALENHYARSFIYPRLGIHTMPQLAPYLFLAAKLDDNEMDSLRRASAPLDGDPMRIIYEKFGMPRDTHLLAPHRYLAAKREMAANN